MKLNERSESFATSLLRNVEMANRNENKRLTESEQDLADQPTEKDIEQDVKDSKETKKKEIEGKMESIIDAMHNTQIDSEEAKSLASEFEGLQSELAKLELEEGACLIDENELNFAEGFCKECGARLDEDDIQVFTKEDAERFLPNIKAVVTSTIIEKYKGINLELPDNGVLDNNKRVINYDIKVLRNDKEDLIGVGEEIAEKLKGTSMFNGKVIDIKCIPEKDSLIVSLIGPDKIIDGKVSETEDLDEGNIFADNSNTLNQLLDRAISELEGDDLFELLQGMIDRIKEVADTCGLMVECDKKNKISETEVKNIKPIKQQGNVFMLEDENGKVIVGEDYNEEDGIIEKAEVYENKDEADKDYLERCNVVKTESDEVEECDKQKVDESNSGGLKEFGSDETKPKKKLADYAK